jgi:hypothetical protein
LDISNFCKFIALRIPKNQTIMNRKIFFSFLAIFVMTFTIITITSCSKDDNDDDSAGNTPPSANFTVTPSSGTTDTQFEFDASGCTDKEDENSVLEIHWDFENDGIWDTDWSSNKTLNTNSILRGLILLR